MAGSARTAPEWSSGDPALATDFNHLSPGRIGHNLRFSSNVSTTTLTAVLACDVTVGTGRLIKIVFKSRIRSDTAGAGYQVRCLEDGSDGFSGLHRWNGTIAKAASDQMCYAEFFSAAPSAGAHTYTIEFGVNGSGPTVSAQCVPGSNDDAPAYIEIYDDGPSFFTD